MHPSIHLSSIIYPPICHPLSRCLKVLFLFGPIYITHHISYDLIIIDHLCFVFVLNLPLLGLQMQNSSALKIIAMVIVNIFIITTIGSVVILLLEFL